jgi:tight adherence protein B
MPTDILLLIYIAVFIGALLFLEGLYFLVIDLHGRSARAVNRRLRMHARGLSREAALVKLRRRGTGDARGLAALLRDIPGYNALDSVLAQSGLQLSPGQAIGVFACCGIAFFLMLTIFTQVSRVPGAAFSAIFGIGVPLLVFYRIGRYRLNKILVQLPDAIDMIVRSLHAGHPVTTALGLVSEEAKDPIGTEFGITVDEMTYGLDLDDALLNMCERLPIREVHFMAVAVRLQHTTGGNLAETLSALARVIRDRRRMRDKIKALSAEGRISATVLSGLPIFVGGGIYLMSPKYYSGIPGDIVLTVAMGVAWLMLLLGIFMLFRVVNFRV